MRRCKHSHHELVTILSILLLLGIFTQNNVVSGGIVATLNAPYTGINNNASLGPEVAMSDGFTFVRRVLKGNLSSNSAGLISCLGFARKSPGAYTFSLWLETPDASLAEIVWSANRNDPVKEGASINFYDGSLMLQANDGRLVWSTKTDGLGAQVLQLYDFGAIYLFTVNPSIRIWNSESSYSTDVLVQGKKLLPGMKLISSVSATNISEGSYSLVMEPSGLAAYYTYSSDADPIPYWIWGYYGRNDSLSVQKTCLYGIELVFEGDDPIRSYTSGIGPGSISLVQSSITAGPASISPELCNITIDPGGVTVRTSTYGEALSRFMRLEPDGNLRIYYADNSSFRVLLDYDFISPSQQCSLPDKCGPYALCSEDNVVQNHTSCSCPVVSGDNTSSLFQPISSNSNGQNEQNSEFEGCNLAGGTPTCDDLQQSSKNNQLTMLEVRGVDYSVLNFRQADAVSISMDACKGLCSENCSCRAAFFREGTGSCFLILSPLQSLKSFSDQSFWALIKRNPDGSSHARGDQGQRKVLALALGVSISILSVLMGCVFSVWHWRRRRQTVLRLQTVLETVQSDESMVENQSTVDIPQSGPVKFSYRELETATGHFTHELGAGAFGTVFKGTLADGQKIAVKSIYLGGGGSGGNQCGKSGKSSQELQFLAEVETIGRINHVNLVELRGYCAELERDLMLVYEFVSNGSLDKWLFGTDDDARELNWTRRFFIAMGAAEGLRYLHDGCREQIVHLDIKPANILLDDNFGPKVADFGLAKWFDRTQHSQVWTSPGGTPGYWAPEIWSETPVVTDKCDVYSYGIVLLNLVTGRRLQAEPVNNGPDGHLSKSDNEFLQSWTVRLAAEERYLDLLDKRLATENVPLHEVKGLIDIAIECMQLDRRERPSMKTVHLKLEKISRQSRPLDPANVEAVRDFQTLKFPFRNPLTISTHSDTESFPYATNIMLLNWGSELSSRDPSTMSDVSHGSTLKLRSPRHKPSTDTL